MSPFTTEVKPLERAVIVYRAVRLALMMAAVLVAFPLAESHASNNNILDPVVFRQARKLLLQGKELQKRKQSEAAQGLLQRAWRLAQKSTEPECPQRKDFLHSLANCHLAMEKWSDAERLFSILVKLDRKYPHPNPLLDVAHIFGLARAQANLGKLEEALIRLDEATKKATARRFKPDSLEMKRFMLFKINMAILLSRFGEDHSRNSDFSRALTYHQSAWRMIETSTTPFDRRREMYLRRWAECVVQLKQWQKAESLFRQLATLAGHHPNEPDNQSDVDYLLRVADALLRQGKLPEAQAIFARTSLGVAQQFGADSQELWRHVRGHLRVCERAGFGYEQLLASLVDRCKDLNGVADLRRGLALEASGRMCARQGNSAEASRFMERACHTYEQIWGPSEGAFESMSMLWTVYTDLGDIARHGSILEHQLSILKEIRSPSDEDIDRFVERAAGFYLANERSTDVIRVVQTHLKWRNTRKCEDGPNQIPALSSLFRAYLAEEREHEATEIATRLDHIIEASVRDSNGNPLTAVSALFMMSRYRYSDEYMDMCVNTIRRILREHELEVDSGAGFHLRLIISKGVADILSSRGFADRDTRNCKSLVQIAQEVTRQLLLAVDDNRDCATPIQRALLFRTAGGWERRYRRFAQAENHLQRCVSICDEIDPIPARLVSQCLAQLADVLTSLGKQPQAEVVLLRAVQIKRAHAHNQQLGLVLLPLANLYRDLGRKADAEKYYALALAELESESDADAIFGPISHTVRHTLSETGKFYIESGQPAKAVACYKRSLHIAEALGMGPIVRYSLLVYLARACGESEDRQNARKYLHRALALTSELKANNSGALVVQIHLGVMDLHDRKFAIAEERFRKAATMADVNSPFFASVQRGLAASQKGQGKSKEALETVLTCIAQFDERYSESRSNFGLHEDAAYYAMRCGNVDLAWSHTEKVIEWRSRHLRKISYNAIERSLSVDSDQWKFERMAVCMAAEAGKHETAFMLWESRAATATRELFATSGADVQSRLPEERRTELRVVTAKVNGLRRQVREQEGTDGELQRLLRSLDTAELEYSVAATEMAAENHRLMANEASAVISYDDVCNLTVLDKTTAIVGWIDFKELHWACVIRSTGVDWIKLPKPSEQEQQAFSLEDIRTNKIIARVGMPKLQQALQPVSEFRIAPLLPKLAGITRLIVVSQGWVTSGCPLELLPFPTDDVNRDEAPTTLLVDHFRISYTPSATMLHSVSSERGETRRWSREFLALADPPFTDQQLARMQQQSATKFARSASPPSLVALRSTVCFSPEAELQRLPATRFEAERIASLFDESSTTLLLGQDANERRLFGLSQSRELMQYRYIHFASHGFLDAERPEFSGVVLALVPRDDSFDGILQMREVFQLRMRPDMVVLSACQTGQGLSVGNEGIVGLSTAFLATGTDSLVVSLWNVPDRSTALLMTQFYKNLRQDIPKAESLQRAKQWLRSLTSEQVKALLATSAGDALDRGTVRERPLARTVQTSHPYADPYFWAAFILIGDPE